MMEERESRMTHQPGDWKKAGVIGNGEVGKEVCF